jgi:hypothetical protein
VRGLARDSSVLQSRGLAIECENLPDQPQCRAIELTDRYLARDACVHRDEALRALSCTWARKPVVTAVLCVALLSVLQTSPCTD